MGLKNLNFKELRSSRSGFENLAKTHYFYGKVLHGKVKILIDIGKILFFITQFGIENRNFLHIQLPPHSIQQPIRFF